MKPVALIAVAVSLVSVFGVLFGIGAYQQAQLEKEQKEADKAPLESLQKSSETKTQSEKIPEYSLQIEDEIVGSKPDESLQEQSKIIQNETPQFFDCSGSAGCLTEYVTRIVDGDTIYTGNLKIRLTLTNTPELDESGFYQAAQFTEKLCPVGSSILIDQDDLQPMDDYGRVLAKVYCGDKVLNSELLYNNHANILTQYCSTSEFSGETWAQEYGCWQKEIQSQAPSPTTPPTTSSQTNENSCDPSYPTVCIPSPPPDLDCGEIQYKKFDVLPPDPHRFDGDKDGIGCES